MPRVNTLAGGVVLSQDDEKIDHFALIPTRADGSIGIDMAVVVGELGLLGLELVEWDEDPWDLTAEGWRVTVATIGGLEPAAA